MVWLIHPAIRAQHNVQIPEGYQSEHLDYSDFDLPEREVVDEQLELQSFDEDVLEDIRDAFDYTKPSEREEEESRELPPNEDDEEIGKGETEPDNSWEIGEWKIPAWLGWIVLISLLALIGFFIYRALDLVDKPVKKAATAADRMAADLSEIPEEELTLQETETLLQRAERTGDFTTAVRLQYLAMLKQLNELELIEYTRDKTDREYRREMDNTDLGSEFSAITIDYARNWYGQYPLDRLSYRLVADRFESLRKKLDGMKKPEYV
ncbi:MAG: DUF4129 domain-containing protein [Bacteroidota bacterium]